MLVGGLFSKRTVLVGLVVALSFLVALPSQAGSFEAVYLLKVMDLEDKAVVVRANGDMYLIEYGIGVLSIWRYEGKTVYIYSPTLFAGIGSKIILPERDQEARIWNSEYLGNYYGSLAPAPPPAPVAPPASPSPQPSPAPPPSPDTKPKRVYQVGVQKGYMFYGPSQKTKVRKVLEKGELVYVYSEKSGWYWAATSDGVKGYVSKTICVPLQR